jgi:hypothetical protein
VTDRSTITKILTMLLFRCPGRDPVSEISKTSRNELESDELRNSMILFWLDQLGDLEEDILLAAVRDLCGSPGQWSPSVGDIRQRAVELSLGQLAPPSGGEAWGRACDWAGGSEIDLTDLERSVIKRLGGSWELKHSLNPTSTRRDFLRFYDEAINKMIAIKRAHPETKKIADEKIPELTLCRVNEKVINLETHGVPATSEQIKEILQRLNFPTLNRRK